MAIGQRIEWSGALYHVTDRGNERQAIFRDDQDRSVVTASSRRCLKELRKIYFLRPDPHFSIVVGNQEATPAESLRADCNGHDCEGDGCINVLDIVKIVNVILGLDECP